MKSQLPGVSPRGRGRSSSPKQGGLTPWSQSRRLPARACPSQRPAQVRTESAATGLVQPTYLTPLPGQDNTLLVLEKSGLIKAVNESTGLASTWLDLTSQVNSSSQGGLFSIAFNSDHSTNGRPYVGYPQKDASETVQRLAQTSSGFTSESLLRFMPDAVADTGAIGAHVGDWLRRLRHGERLVLRPGQSRRHRHRPDTPLRRHGRHPPNHLQLRRGFAFGHLYDVDYRGEVYRTVPEPGSTLLLVADLAMMLRRRTRR